MLHLRCNGTGQEDKNESADKKRSQLTQPLMDRSGDESGSKKALADQYRRCVWIVYVTVAVRSAPQLNWPFKRAFSESRGINGTWSLYCKLNQNYSAHSFRHRCPLHFGFSARFSFLAKFSSFCVAHFTSKTKNVFHLISEWAKDK